jgi:hypothetical protein
MNKIMNPSPQVSNRHGDQIFLTIKEVKSQELLQESQYSHKNVVLHCWQFLLIKPLWL